ncbi:MAG: type III-A CRISPR-associated RAMP protein Csm5 [Thermodesulforhabdaceae bacterium]|jgi:CRISPR-associated protein Csm5
MKRRRCIQVARLELTVETPVYIGSRFGVLYPMEFIYSNGRTYVVNEEKLGKILHERGLLEKFIQQTYSGDLSRRGLGWFLSRELREVKPENYASYFVRGGNARLTRFRPFVRDGQNNIYLPGTSIKGAIRTAVLYSFLKKNPGNWEKRVEGWIDELQKKRARGKAKKRDEVELSLDMQRELLQSFPLPWSSSARHQNRDIFRCLIVRDAYPAENQFDVRLVPVKFLCKREEDKFYWSSGTLGSGDLEVWIEAIVSGMFVCEIAWDETLFEAFRKENRDLPVNSFKEVFDSLLHSV